VRRGGGGFGLGGADGKDQALAVPVEGAANVCRHLDQLLLAPARDEGGI
jgi:hypothetical protein